MSVKGFAGLLGVLALVIGASAPVMGQTQIVASGERYSVQGNLEDYKLGVGDKVRLTVFNEPTLSGEFSVSPQGTLSLPFVGDLKVIDSRPADVGQIVQTQLADGYLRNPKVSVEVITYRPFFILGEVKSPGQYPYASNLTVLNAVATSQGFTPRANRKIVYIRKSGSSDEQPYRLTPDLRVLPGDTLRIGERYF